MAIGTGKISTTFMVGREPPFSGVGTSIVESTFQVAADPFGIGNMTIGSDFEVE